LRQATRRRKKGTTCTRQEIRGKREVTRGKTQDTCDNTRETRHETRHVLAGWEEGTVTRERGEKSALKRRKTRACPQKPLKKARITHEN